MKVKTKNLLMNATWLAAMVSAPLVGIAIGNGAVQALAIQPSPVPVLMEEPEPDEGQRVNPRAAAAIRHIPKRLVYHLSGGYPGYAPPQYHATACMPQRLVQRLSPEQVGEHIYQANTGSVGVALACGYGSVYIGPGRELRGGVLPVRQQEEDAAAYGAEVALKYRIDLAGRSQLANGLWVPNLGEHHDFAVLMGYASLRNDMGKALMDRIRSKIKWYEEGKKSGRLKFEFIKP